MSESGVVGGLQRRPSIFFNRGSTKEGGRKSMADEGNTDFEWPTTASEYELIEEAGKVRSVNLGLSRVYRG